MRPVSSKYLVFCQSTALNVSVWPDVTTRQAQIQTTWNSSRSQKGWKNVDSSSQHDAGADKSEANNQSSGAGSPLFTSVFYKAASSRDVKVSASGHRLSYAWYFLQRKRSYSSRKRLNESQMHSQQCGDSLYSVISLVGDLELLFSFSLWIHCILQRVFLLGVENGHPSTVITADAPY